MFYPTILVLLQLFWVFGGEPFDVLCSFHAVISYQIYLVVTQPCSELVLLHVTALFEWLHRKWGIFFILFLFDHSDKDCHTNRLTCVESLPSVEFVMGFRWTTVHRSYKPSWELLQMIPMFHIPRQRRVILILKVSGKLLGKRHLSTPGAPGS